MIREIHKAKIKKNFGYKEFQYIILALIEGNKRFKVVKPMIESKGDMSTHQGAIGHIRTKMICDHFCNDLVNASRVGFEVDIFKAGSTNIPKLIKDNTIVTLQSCKNIQEIINDPSEYMKELSKRNKKLNLQVSLFDNEKETKEDNIKYYGMIVYHFEDDSTLEFVKLVFFDEDFKSTLLELEAPREIFDSIVATEEKAGEKEQEKEDPSTTSHIKLKPQIKTK